MPHCRDVGTRQRRFKPRCDLTHSPYMSVAAAGANMPNDDKPKVAQIVVEAAPDALGCLIDGCAHGCLGHMVLLLAIGMTAINLVT